MVQQSAGEKRRFRLIRGHITGEALEGLTKSADNVFGTMPEDMSTVGEAIGEVNTRFHTTGTELEKTSKQFIQFATINGTNVTQSVDQVEE